MAKNTASGYLLINKPAGPTSHDMVATVRRALGIKRVGHTGTLDPFASGLLIILAGRATRLAEYIHRLPKTYKATAILGGISTTDDATGDITPYPNVKQPARQDVEQAVEQFRGDIMQAPPAYAAVKYKGKKLYEYARQGMYGDIQHDIKKRPVTIHSIDIVSYNYPELTMAIKCGTGTYIRALARDIGEVLRTGAYTKTLTRTAIGAFSITDSISLSKNALTQQSIRPAHHLIAHLPRINVDENAANNIAHGKPISAPSNTSIPANMPIAVFGPQNTFIGIVQRQNGTIAPEKVFV